LFRIVNLKPKFDGFVKSQKMHILSFRRKPESSNFSMFWMPDQVRHDEFGLFTESSSLDSSNLDFHSVHPSHFGH